MLAINLILKLGTLGRPMFSKELADEGATFREDSKIDIDPAVLDFAALRLHRAATGNGSQAEWHELSRISLIFKGLRRSLAGTRRKPGLLSE